MELIGYIAALLMGLFLGLTGAGGSILTVPILFYFFKQDALLATTGSLFVVGAIALVGASYNTLRGLVDFKTGVTFAVPSFVGVFFSRRIFLPLIPNTIQLSDQFMITKSFLVLFCFALLMILSSRAMIRSGSLQVSSNIKSPDFKSIALKGFLVGSTTGFAGSGGGFIIIPTLVVLLQMPIRTAIGTSLAIIAANSLFGFVISSSTHIIDWQLLLSITALGICGLFLGQFISPRFSDNRLKQGFGYFVLIVGLIILIEQAVEIFPH